MKESFSIEFKSGNYNFLLRYPEKGDLGKMHKYINFLSKEQTFVNYQGEEISLKEEDAYLKDQLRRIKNKSSVQLLAFIGSEIVGVSSVDLAESTYSHEGVLSISVLEGYRNLGLGKVLLSTTLFLAEERIKNLKLITLTVFGNNSSAYEFYKSFGFKEFGRLPEGVYYKGRYYDRIYMYKNR